MNRRLMLVAQPLRQQIGIIVVTVAALLVTWGGQAAAQEPVPTCPDTVEGWLLTETILAPPTSAGVLRLICSYNTPGGYDDPHYGNDLTFDAHWWPEGTQVPSYFCPFDPDDTRQLPSSVAAAEVGWKWTFESAFSDADLGDVARGLLRQVEPLAQQCPQEADDSAVTVVISSNPNSTDDAQALPAAPATSEEGGGLGDLAVPAAVLAAGAAVAAWQIQTRRQARHTPTLGDRLAADALREAAEAANAPSLGDQLAAEQIRQGLALGHLYPFDGFPVPPTEQPPPPPPKP
jgi:hypothetical protein